jgi:predicted O-methyltransferase YrrM
MTQPSDSERLESFLLDLYGGDPYAYVRDASNEHREAHGPECGVYPSDPIKMRLIATLVRALGAKRILEIGCGLGYSALWLADAAGPDGHVDTIDRFPEHVALSRRYAAEAGHSHRLQVIGGEGTDVLATLSGPYDLVHDDGWFAAEPPYLERMIDLTRPGSLIALSNWFLLEDAVTAKPQMDWSAFAGPDWADHVQAYARRLAAHPQLSLSFVLRPWLALAVKTA